MKLIETWVKAPFLKNASLLILGECAQSIYPDVCEGFMEGRVTLTHCPEAEDATKAMGKLASIVTCSNPRDITVLTVEGSPHCFTLHAAMNEALFVSNSEVPSRHFVITEGEAVEVSPESVRIGRYLHLVQKCIEKYPEIVEDLSRLSLEHCWFRRKR
ncbi:MAG: 4Fe-4S ferredoxin [Candidatus Geothermarchaeales archaeon]